MKRALAILVVGLSLLFPALVAAEIYKWVDEKGTVHFSEDPQTIPEKQTEETQSATTGTVLGNPSKQLKEDERITYYYRNPRPNELIPILESILGEKETITNLETVKPLVHFFATALQKDLNRVKDLEKLQLNYSGEARQMLQTLIKEVRNYHPADVKSPKDLELLWFEYEASGNKEIIERLIKVVAATIPSKANTLQVAVIQSLIENAPYHSEVYGMLRKRPEPLFAEIVSIIRLSAFDPAQEHLSRGLNLFNEWKYDEAMQEYKKSLSYVPDYFDAYVDIANIYNVQRKYWEAIKMGKKALSIEPDNPIVLHNLGLYYGNLNEQDEAIKWYQKCLECDPKEVDCHYGLGFAYKNKQDNNRAAFHFGKYLEYAPNGKQALNVKRHLASIGQTVKEDPGDVAVMLQNKKYDVLEKHLLSLLKGKTRDKDGQSPLTLAYEKLCNVQEPERSFAPKIAQFKAWLNQYNSSHFANACLGIVYTSYAWYARGSGYASTITEQGGRLFEERLLTAKDYLEKAYSLDQSDPNVPTNLIIVAKGLGLDRKEMEKQFQRAILADPTDQQAYFEKLGYLMPKWYGSNEEMFSFAREAVRKAPANSMIPMVLLGAHLDVYYRSGENASYFRNPNVWKELKQVFQTVSKSFPEARGTNNWFARTAYLAGDYEVARNELKKIGYDWQNWQKRVWGDKTTLEEVKRELSVK